MLNKVLSCIGENTYYSKKRFGRGLGVYNFQVLLSVITNKLVRLDWYGFFASFLSVAFIVGLVTKSCVRNDRPMSPIKLATEQ